MTMHKGIWEILNENLIDVFSQDQQQVQQMSGAVDALQVQEHRQEQEEEEEERCVSVKQQQRQGPRVEQVELAREACGDFTPMILQELKCKYFITSY